MSASAGFPTFASYGVPYIYGTPSMEFPGLIKIALHGGRACDPDRRDWSGDGGEMVRQVTDWIERVMPDTIVTSGGPVISQACMYSMTPDEDYVIDFIGGEFGNDVVVAGGFSGHGFKMGPLVGKILVEMAFDGEATTLTRIGVDVKALFGLGRFAENSKGNVKEFEDQVV
ncbi:hypothetical protein HPP92_016807 [Vanilla planifolia]|uniref:FAD dependent oxidoreductase domain-containing protein n=1 Tax=Vanilla planifolia TaxID=51239 RepID=A0A835QJW8_VANPL|nr:hypothetical protein HPP92_016807 [Vanilla planifolia]